LGVALRGAGVQPRSTRCRASCLPAQSPTHDSPFALVGARETDRWHDRILAGLDFGAVDNIKTRAALTDAELARLLGMGEATLRRARGARAKLDPATSDRLYRLSKVVAVAEEALEGAGNAMQWLRRAQPALLWRSKDGSR
jgi:putative toxin-antitoxin system antitoxin component (TIGR02293 family)